MASADGRIEGNDTSRAAYSIIVCKLRNIVITMFAADSNLQTRTFEYSKVRKSLVSIRIGGDL